jgi:hypothetical protein
MALKRNHPTKGKGNSNGLASKGKITGMTPSPAGKPKGGKHIQANNCIKGGSGSC